MPSSDVLLDPQIRTTLLQHLSPGAISYGDPDPDGIALRHVNQKTLARLARVCRAMSEASLDLLWRSIDDFRFLLRPFKLYHGAQCTIADMVTEEQWARFCSYARRVRELRLSNAAKVHASVWTILTRWCLREPLLPNLERLTEFELSEMSACYSILFTHTLRHLGLMVHEESDEGTDAETVDMGVRIVRPLFGQLESLCLNDGRYARDDKVEAVRFWELSHLRELRVKHKVVLTEEMVRSLAAFPHLRVLHVSMKTLDIKDGTGIAAAFSSLHTLELVGSLKDVEIFLQVAPPPRVEEVTLRVEAKDEGGASKDTTNLLQKILSHLPTSTLRRFRAECKSRQYGSRARVDPAATLEQLAAFPDLTSIVLTFDDKLLFPLSDDCLSSHLGTWPQLTAFEIHATPQTISKDTSYHDEYIHYGSRSYRGYESRSHDPYGREQSKKDTQEPTPTIATMAAFASAHPHLERFVLPTLDLTAVPDIASVPHLNHGLRTLKFIELADGVPLLPFVLALDLLFPRLDLVVAEKGLTPGSSPDRAQQLLMMLLAVQAGRVGKYRDHGPDSGVYGVVAGRGEKIRLIREGQLEEKGRAVAGEAGEGGHSPPPLSAKPRSPPRTPPGYECILGYEQ